MQIGVETSRAVDNKRIFVVDDDEINRAVLQFMLQDENETHDLASLEAAYEKGEPDLVLLGLSILCADDTVLAGLAARWPKARILVVAQASDEQAAQRFLRAGAHGLLMKPFTVEAVRRKADIQLGRVVPSLIQLQVAR